MSQGRLRYHVLAQSNLDQYTGTTDPTAQKFIRDHVTSIGTYSSYFDAKLAWFPDALAYVDSYAIYLSDPLVTQHTDWILRNAAGKPLYIPWGAKNATGQLPQYAGDFSNAGFRQYQIGRMQTLMGIGYKGIWIDDVNLPVRSTDGTTDANGNYNPVLPPNWTADIWAQNMSDFMRLIRAALPKTAVLLHNAIWSSGALTTAIKTQISACDFFYLERGVSDAGLTGGNGQYSLTNFFAFIDKLHAEDTPMVMGDYSIVTMEYSVAGYLLIAEDGDMIGFGDQPLTAPWPALLSLDLGAVNGQRHNSAGIWSRQFARGAVYLAEPGTAQISFTLPKPAYDLTGNEVASLTLSGGQAKVILFEV